MTQTAEQPSIYTPAGLEEALYTVEGIAPEIDSYDDLSTMLRGVYDIPGALAACVQGFAARNGLDNQGNVVLGHDKGWQVTAATTERDTDEGAEHELLVVNLFKRSKTRLRWMGQNVVLIMGISGEGDLGTSDVAQLDWRQHTERYFPYANAPAFAERYRDRMNETVEYAPSGQPITHREVIWQNWQQRQRTFAGFLAILFEAGSAVVNLTEV